MEGTSPDGKSQLKQESLRTDGRLLRQLEGPTAQTGGNQRKQESPAQTVGLSPDGKHHYQPRQEEHILDWRPFRPKGKPTPRQEALAQAGGPSAQREDPDSGTRLLSPYEGPFARSGWNPFAQTGGPAQTEGSQPTQAAHPRREH